MLIQSHSPTVFQKRWQSIIIHVMSVHDVEQHKSQFEAIQQAVAAEFGLASGELIGSGMTRRVIIPRQIAIYLASLLIEASVLQIGQHFGKHYTTVMQAVMKIEAQRHGRPDVAAMINVLLRTLSKH